jgi:hypothetical protein
MRVYLLGDNVGIAVLENIILGGNALGGATVKPYPLGEDLGRSVPRVAMPRAPRMHAPGGTNLLYLFCLATSPITS